MPDPHPGRPFGFLALYNVVQNSLLPPAAYVPMNLAVAAALVADAHGQGCSWDDLGLDLTHWRRALAEGMLGVGLTATAVTAVATVPYVRTYLVDERARHHSTREVLFRALIRFPFGTALFEEVAFRGVLYGTCRTAGMPPGPAAWLTAAAFGAWHFLPGRSALTGNPLAMQVKTKGATIAAVGIGAVVTAVSSLWLTRLRNRTRGLLAPWLLHAGVNSIGYLSGVIAWRRLERHE